MMLTLSLLKYEWPIEITPIQQSPVAVKSMDISNELLGLALKKMKAFITQLSLYFMEIRIV